MSPFQYFGLLYSLAQEERQKLQESEGFIKQLVAVMDPIRFRQVYLNEVPEGVDDFDEIPGYEVQPDDFHDIDQYLQTLDQVRTGAV